MGEPRFTTAPAPLTRKPAPPRQTKRPDTLPTGLPAYLHRAAEGIETRASLTPARVAALADGELLPAIRSATARLRAADATPEEREALSENLRLLRAEAIARGFAPELSLGELIAVGISTLAGLLGRQGPEGVPPPPGPGALGARGGFSNVAVPAGVKPLDILPESTVISNLTPIRALEAYRACIAEDPLNEVGVYRDLVSGERVVVKGLSTSIQFIEYITAHAEFANGIWVPEVHYHPGRDPLARMPSPEDFASMLQPQLQGLRRWRSLQNEVEYHDPATGQLRRTRFGYRHGAAEPFWIEYEALDGSRQRRTFLETPWLPHGQLLRFLATFTGKASDAMPEQIGLGWIGYDQPTRSGRVPEAEIEPAAPRYSPGMRVAAGATGALLVAEELLRHYGEALEVQRTGIARGEAEIAFWQELGLAPVRRVWDSAADAPAAEGAETGTGFHGGLVPYVADIDASRLMGELPKLITGLPELEAFIAGARAFSALRQEGEAWYLVFNRLAPASAWRVYDASELMALLASRAASEERFKAELAALPEEDLAGRVFHLAQGAELRRTRDGSRPMPGAGDRLGPNAWVREVRRQSSFWSGDHVLVRPANADAARAVARATWYVKDPIEDVWQEVRDGGRTVDPPELPKLWQPKLQQFTAGPETTGEERFGATVYTRDPRAPLGLTVATGELRAFWVAAADLTPVEAREVAAFLGR